MDIVRDPGHLYARTTRQTETPFPPENPMAFHPCRHFLAPDFWQCYENARQGGVFYFWGHSYEISTEGMWRTVEAMMSRISADPDSEWRYIEDLFTDGA